MWSTFSSTPLNAEEQAGLSVEFQTKERIEDDTTDDNTNDTTPSQSDVHTAIPCVMCVIPVGVVAMSSSSFSEDFGYPN